jgi:hypothetical protein
MTERSTPRVTRNHGVKEYTSICFTPDFGRFRMEGLDEDIIALFTKRAYDMAGVLEDVRVVLNGERIPISGFQSYIKVSGRFPVSRCETCFIMVFDCSFSLRSKIKASLFCTSG